MQIETGKYYRTRDGRKVGPILNYNHNGWLHVQSGTVAGNCLWEIDGQTVGGDRDSDLLSEWPSGPVREVTRKEIVPGVYGLITTGPVEANCFVRIGVTRELFNAAELRAAAEVLTQIADAITP